METNDERREGEARAAAAISVDENGGGSLELHYTGLLAGFDPVWVRLGEHRHGAEWMNVRDVEMAHVEGEEAIVSVTFPPGDPLEGAELVFFAADETGEHPVWDNAGRPFGYYEVDARTGSVEPR
jgi:hypothetical protein